ncbi:MAG: CRISPR-associated endonuclease Cas3'', partial [Gammaproteobacteria bacterium]|nr:CRISPR-associated endonuclease Cas3'' [Gammaproteobacteria bacterium]
MAEVLVAALPPAVQALLPRGAATLAALHDVGKITLGFQAKCPEWLQADGLPSFLASELVLSVSDHALVSQVFLQKHLPTTARLWAVAVGAHHGRTKGWSAKLPNTTPECHVEWAEPHRVQLMEALSALFGLLPDSP